MKDETCKECRYYVKTEGKCLICYEGFFGIEKVKFGLIGKCDDFKEYVFGKWDIKE